jgi:hypothetical protein
MGKMLQREVESQLLQDLEHYGITTEGVAIDWSEACQEGHCTKTLGGWLESQSCVEAVDSRGEVVAEGWIDFIHGGNGNPLFVFWCYLSVVKDGEKIEAKRDHNIPAHIWSVVPEAMKALCTKSGTYDAAWHKDPLVTAWSRASRAV